LGKKFGFESTVTDNDLIFSDPEINTVFITTRHASHGPLVLKALKAGKNVFVEKPLCIHRNEFAQIREWYQNAGEHAPILLVGFNRRFSPIIRKMKGLVSGRTDPLAMTYNVNAGSIPRDHWSQDRGDGGGRVLGEACHFIDTLRYLSNSEICSVSANYAMNRGSVVDDIVTVNLSFADGSIGTVNYFANGNKTLEREALDVYCGGGILRMNNFRKLTGFKWPGFRKLKLRRQDKGHGVEISDFINAGEKGGEYPIPLKEIFEVTEASFTADEQARDN
jgi:predicted dehydrogenase